MYVLSDTKINTCLGFHNNICVNSKLLQPMLLKGLSFFPTAKISQRRELLMWTIIWLSRDFSFFSLVRITVAQVLAGTLPLGILVALEVPAAMLTSPEVVYLRGREPWLQCEIHWSLFDYHSSSKKENQKCFSQNTLIDLVWMLLCKTFCLLSSVKYCLTSCRD